MLSIHNKYGKPASEDFCRIKSRSPIASSTTFPERPKPQALNPRPEP